LEKRWVFETISRTDDEGSESADTADDARTLTTITVSYATMLARALDCTVPSLHDII
jgi:hypothetical protein